MIGNDQELAVTRERVAKLERLLEDLRKTARPEEWPALSSGYRLKIERAQGEILDHLVRAAPDARRTTTAGSAAPLGRREPEENRRRAGRAREAGRVTEDRPNVWKVHGARPLRRALATRALSDAELRSARSNSRTRASL